MTLSRLIALAKTTIPAASGRSSSVRINRAILLGLLGLVYVVSAHSAFGQAVPTASTPFNAGVGASIGGANTQMPFYADNALGYSVSAFLQPSYFIGFEARAARFPYRAEFSQSPVTVGLRFRSGRGPESRYTFVSYVGAGYSKAQDSSNGYKPLAAIWSPCWQVTQAVEVPLGRLRWRVYEAGWTETYTTRRNVPDRSLRTLSLTTGLVFSLH
jgi:hypothetical protein